MNDHILRDLIYKTTSESDGFHPKLCSLHASPPVSVKLKFPAELNLFSDASRVCEPANESLLELFLRNLHVTKNKLSFAGSQTLLTSENKFSSTGSLNFTETVGAACRLKLYGKKRLTQLPIVYNSNKTMACKTKGQLFYRFGFLAFSDSSLALEQSRNLPTLVWIHFLSYGQF